MRYDDVRNDNVVELQRQKRFNSLDIIELYEEINRLELDLKIHERYRVNASSDESQLNEYMINQTKQNLSQLYKLQLFER